MPERQRRRILGHTAIAFDPIPVPLRADADGTIRVGGTRVTLDAVVGAFLDGATAEGIVDHMDSQPPHERPPHSPPYTAPLPYQSPGAHQKSQWVTDEQATGKILIGCAIVVSIVGAVIGAIASAVWFVMGF